ncbi:MULTISPECIES: DUF4124 domain-containing protein [Ramlibacter]|uniref:DUF4124 domain-containing protein n=1 Tax=Ramlibacter aquaticus TaxID=2780094 RepID=A0ABR9SFS1_9BURK|nr:MULTISPECIES: DUF4124 domain-containing protein [Ramlibacter]MBE7941202.1 DUF4124 domain-containing protein [Ramlibacter aquaticus]
MQLLRFCALIALVAAAPAFAQWQWVDKDGRKVFSDQAPPADVPANRVLKRPGRFAAAEAAQAAQAASDAAAAQPAAAPRPTGRDKDLEDKKKQLQAAADEKRHAQEEANARIKADNCQRARRGKAALDSGVRIAQTNDKGEREFLDDAQREAEGRRLDAVIAHECL